MNITSWKPSKKWWAALVGGVTPILLSGIDSGFDVDTEGSMAITLVAGLLLAYAKRNDTTLTGDGVPH